MKLKAGSLVFEVGDSAHSVYLVLSGQVRLSKPALDGSRLIPVGVVRPRQFFGASEVLQGVSRGLRADTVSGTELLEVPIDPVVDLLRLHPREIAGNLARQLEELLEENAMEMAAKIAEQQREEALGSFIRGILSESEPLVTRAMLLAEDLSEQLQRSESGPQAQQLLATVQALVNQKRELATFARPAATGKLDERDLHLWLKQLSGQLADPLAQYQCTLDAYAESIMFSTDFEMLDQVLQSLFLRLAVLARQENSIKIRAGLEGSEMLLRVTYRHPGLTEYLAMRLFEPFSEAGHGQTTGLELTATRRFARIHGGDMVIENRSGQTVTLALRLPARVSMETARLNNGSHLAETV